MRLGENDDALGAGARILGSEDRDATLADARHIADGGLDLLRIDVAAGADDDVLGAAGDEHVAAGDIGEIAAVEPFPVEELAGLDGVAEIARGRGRAAKLQPSFLPLAELPGRVDDADLMARQGATAGDELQRVGIVGRRRAGFATLSSALRDRRDR